MLRCSRGKTLGIIKQRGKRLLPLGLRDSIACIRRTMPKVTIRELTARVEAAAAEEMRLKATVERLQLVVREQAELLRGAGKGAAAVPAAAQRPIEFHCPICFEALNDLDPTLTCSHEICHKCCLKHFAEQINCPICRKKASPKELWRFRRPTLARYWKCLRGADWPRLGDIVVVTTTLHTLAGRMLETSDERKTITLAYNFTEWEIQLDDVQELFTLQHLVDSLPPREDGLRRTLINTEGM
jgi:Zinc finger, C3HC4 type (RING finger)